MIVEPSAGNGSFIDAVKLLCDNYMFYDIEPEHVDIVKQDYLLCDMRGICSRSRSRYKRIHVIGNPPFGRQSSLAIKFIKKSVEYCHSISFILPKSFKKDSLKKHFPLDFHLVLEYDLPDDAFTVGGVSHNVPCVFQVWEKQDTPRLATVVLTPNRFQFVSKNDEPDISFRRVGVNAGAIDTDIEPKSVQSHYFIKLNNVSVEDAIKKLSVVKFEFNNTVGPKSISKQELIKEFNKIL
jgi:predicted RNA methylase